MLGKTLLPGEGCGPSPAHASATGQSWQFIVQVVEIDCSGEQQLCILQSTGGQSQDSHGDPQEGGGGFGDGEEKELD